MMSVGEKRAFELRKKVEKEYDERVKLLFVTIVASYSTSRARIMKVIDMTNDPVEENIEKSPKRKKSKSKKHKKSAKAFRMINIESIDLNNIEDAQSPIPKLLMSYSKVEEVRRLKRLEEVRLQEVIDAKAR
jgi:hypothetical protein